ncbi:capsule biosynthesis protein [Tateyamaria omphalii]|nr:capsule biosynthesis protein [Tateyamaria omphalii]
MANIPAPASNRPVSAADVHEIGPADEAAARQAEQRKRKKARKEAAQQAVEVPAPAPAPPPSSPPARPARVRRRHWGVLLSFVLLVMLPSGGVAWYLWERAVDQYASTVAFSVRKEEAGSAVELLGGITELSGSSSSDTDILYEFIQSQQLVSDIDALLDLDTIWSLPGDADPFFSYDATGTIEDLVGHWERKVRIYYDSGSGLIEVRVLAFRPDDATAIATAIYDRSSAMINELSDIAREDSIRYARADLTQAEDRLRDARAAVTEFRNLNQMVDPETDIATQAGLLGSLQSQLSEALIEVNLLRDIARDNDPRIEQAERRVRVVEEMISQERRKLGFGDDGAEGEVFANLVGEFERLAADREFAERSYTGALASYDSAVAEARRQSRYLAAHVLPTEAQRADYPKRWTLLGLVSLFIFLAWAIAVLVAYALRDRR